jgi:fructokinase
VSYVLCVGEALIDFVAQSAVPDVGASEFFRRAPGGAVANVSVGIARLGGSVRFVGSLSEDSFGRFLKRTLVREKVNIDGVRTVSAATTLAFVARGERGARDFFFVRTPGADSLVETADISEQTIASARVVHFGGVLLSTEPARSACFGAANTARQTGALVSFDPNVRQSLWESSAVMRRVLLAGANASTLVKLSEDDARALAIEPSAVSKLLNETTRAVILTRAERGAAFVTLGTGLQEVPAPDIDPVDTTGAGDAFMAALLWRLERYGYELTPAALADAVRYGCAAGAVACLTEGAIPSLPTVAALEAMMARLPHSS